MPPGRRKGGWRQGPEPRAPSAGRLGAAADEVDGVQPEHAAIVAGEQLGPGADDAAVRLGLRRPGPGDGGPEPDAVAWPQRRRPAQLVYAGRGEAGNPGQVMVGDQPHHDPG